MSVKATHAQATQVLLLGEGLVDNQPLLTNLLAEHNLQVLARKNSVEQLEQKEVKTFRLIVLEINDSNLTSLDWLKLVKTQIPSIKFIVVNNGNSIDLVAKAFLYGANDFFRTPLDLNLLSERITSLLNKN